MIWTPRQARTAAEGLAAGLPSLLVEAKRIAASLRAGSHGRQRSGPGESFWQFRRYQAGDPTSAIDWRQSAKSDPLFVRETEWTAAQTVWIWVDASPSMRWRSETALPEKYHRAALLGLALALLLLEGGERVGFLGCAQPAASGPAMFDTLAAGLFEAPGTMSLPHPGEIRSAELVVLSDFLAASPDGLARELRLWAGTGAKGHLVHLQDPAERDFPFAGRVRFSGLEGEADLMVAKAESLRAAYRIREAGHRAALGELARSLRWTMAFHATDHAPEACLAGLRAGLAKR